MNLSKKYNVTPFMVHANWNKGAKEKLAFLRAAGYWYLDDN
jgi:hypothetical protein